MAGGIFVCVQARRAVRGAQSVLDAALGDAGLEEVVGQLRPMWLDVVGVDRGDRRDDVCMQARPQRAAEPFV